MTGSDEKSSASPVMGKPFGYIPKIPHIRRFGTAKGQTRQNDLFQVISPRTMESAMVMVTPMAALNRSHK